MFYMLVAEGGLGAKVLWTFLLQIPLAVVALLFVGLGRLFGAFDPEEIGAPAAP
ncbi:hypothetical protein [Phenylobacterium sp.]|uniref:hypothetical protein n=1 Tax=Phenylobacterium sp. TaxID=1871053 RepID=UPI00391912F5